MVGFEGAVAHVNVSSKLEANQLTSSIHIIHLQLPAGSLTLMRLDSHMILITEIMGIFVCIAEKYAPTYSLSLLTMLLQRFESLSVFEQ